MNGKINFKTIEDLADFLKAFSGATATFEVNYAGGYWTLEFQGGH